MASPDDAPPTQTGADPSRPEFGSPEPTLRERPPSRTHGHPVEAALRASRYPATRQELVSVVRTDPSIDDEVASWLETVLPEGTYADADEALARIGRSGMGPPARTSGT
jgi:hypothetical protein